MIMIATSAVAAMAVRMQKRHRAINQTAMMAIDVLTNPAAPVAGVAEAKVDANFKL